jgi:predicted Zn-dependent protease
VKDQHDVGAEPYLSAAKRAGGDAVVRISEERREELSVRSGLVEFEGVGTERLVGVQFSRAGRCSFVTAPYAAEPESVILHAVALAAQLSPSATEPPEEDDAVLPQEPPIRPAPLAASRDQLLSASACGPDERREIRCVQRTRWVRLAATSGRTGSYGTSRASLELRFVRRRDGRVGSAAGTDHGPDAATVVTRLCAGGADMWLKRAGLLSYEPACGPLPADVILDAHVAGQLVKFMSGSFAADSVDSGNSRLYGMLGKSVASPQVSFVDDPVSPELALPAPFDDEGERACARVLVADGVLNGYIGSRRYSHVPGASLGSAWQQSATASPRPVTRNLYISPAQTPFPVPDDALIVVQAWGTYSSNSITGDFSMGARGLIHSHGQIRPAPPLTIAGNIFSMLHRVEAIGDQLQWCGGNAGTYGAPSLVVQGISVGV